MQFNNITNYKIDKTYSNKEIEFYKLVNGEIIKESKNTSKVVLDLENRDFGLLDIRFEVFAQDKDGNYLTSHFLQDLEEEYCLKYIHKSDYLHVTPIKYSQQNKKDFKFCNFNIFLYLEDKSGSIISLKIPMHCYEDLVGFLKETEGKSKFLLLINSKRLNFKKLDVNYCSDESLKSKLDQYISARNKKFREDIRKIINNSEPNFDFTLDEKV